MDPPKKDALKPSAAQLIAELEALQEVADEIRARIKATMAELEANSAHIRKAIERAADNMPDS